MRRRERLVVHPRRSSRRVPRPVPTVGKPAVKPSTERPTIWVAPGCTPGHVEHVGRAGRPATALPTSSPPTSLETHAMVTYCSSSGSRSSSANVRVTSRSTMPWTRSVQRDVDAERQERGVDPVEAVVGHDQGVTPGSGGRGRRPPGMAAARRRRRRDRRFGPDGRRNGRRQCPPHDARTAAAAMPVAPRRSGTGTPAARRDRWSRPAPDAAARRKPPHPPGRAAPQRLDAEPARRGPDGEIAARTIEVCRIRATHEAQHAKAATRGPTRRPPGVRGAPRAAPNTRASATISTGAERELVVRAEQATTRSLAPGGWSERDDGGAHRHREAGRALDQRREELRDRERQRRRDDTRQGRPRPRDERTGTRRARRPHGRGGVTARAEVLTGPVSDVPMTPA